MNLDGDRQPIRIPQTLCQACRRGSGSESPSLARSAPASGSDREVGLHSPRLKPTPFQAAQARGVPARPSSRRVIAKLREAFPLGILGENQFHFLPNHAGKDRRCLRFAIHLWLPRGRRLILLVECLGQWPSQVVDLPQITPAVRLDPPFLSIPRRLIGDRFPLSARYRSIGEVGSNPACVKNKIRSLVPKSANLSAPSISGISSPSSLVAVSCDVSACSFSQSR